ncbi:hypothetical protein GC096_34170 [Paenibacillus sp. LMG 31461]|uniref:BIG2 domain-containing protein n=1 Tax=Paenibacillus plantarum TaxID=2654975 RepID=A0ABX1XL89_9BACL|nr:glycoside hydrolase family 44 protein [Paenibacillus plantarum]NOU69069.1 hypothetical protein [Paenibacillus plantarum]
MKQRRFKKAAAMRLTLAIALVLAGSNSAGDLGGLPSAEAASIPDKFTVFDDKLRSSFADYSWANHSLSEKKTVHTGSKSIRMKPNHDDGLYLYNDRILRVSDYPVLELWLNGGLASAQKLEIVLNAGGEQVASIPLNESHFQAGTWQKVTIELDKLAIPNGLFDGILIRGTTAGQQPEVYIDDIALSGRVVETEDTAVLTGISVTPSRLNLLTGQTGNIAVQAAYSNGTSAPLTQGAVWSSSDPTVASVANGTVQALKAGSSVLSVVYGTARAEATVRISEIAPPPVQDGQAAMNIYEEGLNDAFQDYSWATHNLAESSVVHTGSKAISFNPSGQGGLYLYKGNGAVQVKDYDRLEFWINGGDAGAQQLELVFNAGGQAAAKVDIGSLIEGGKIPANGWTKVQIQLPELQMKEQLFDGLLFSGLSSGEQGTIYLDDIRLLEKYVAPPELVEGVLSQYGMVLAPGDNAKLTYEARYSNNTSADVSDRATWTTSDPSIIAVDKGVLTATGSGLAKLTAVYGTASASMYVQVVPVTPEAIYRDGLAEGYDTWSWGTNNFDNVQPTASGTKSISFLAQGYDGIWMHRNTKMDLNHYAGLSLKIHGGSTGGQKLHVNLMDDRSFVGELNLDSVLPEGVPANQWTEVKLKFADLGIRDLTFDGVVVSAWGEHDQGLVYFDDISMLKTTSVVSLPDPELPTVQVTIDSTKGHRALSPGIFGVNFEDSPSEGHSTMNVPVKRWGGNAMTRYNWEIDTTNRGGDWYFLNIANDNTDPSKLPNGSLSDRFIQDSKNTGTEVLLQVPTIGWTPKDRKTSWSFSIDKYGQQQGNECDWHEAWCRKDAGNGRNKDGSYLTGNNPTDTSKQVSYDFVRGWVQHIQQQFGSYVHNYALDNEPMLWPHSHWDVHPQMTTYDEVWNYTQGYAQAIKQADPEANIFGPVPWGWCEYFYSAKDGCSPGKDMEDHNNKPYLEWFLGKVEDYRLQTGQRLVDTLDIHYYPAENNVAFSSDESKLMRKRRFDSLKSLYDPSFTDPSSWIQEPVNLIPRMHELIARNSPGMKLSISEYNFGDGTGIGSGLAQAEALALFAREGVDYAMRWGALLGNTPLEDAFKLYLDYDGQGSRIEGEVVSATSSNLNTIGAYTIVSPDGKQYVLLFNKDTAPREAKLESDLSLNAAASVYRFDAQKRLAPAGTVQGTSQGLSVKLPAMSATLIVIP